MFRSRSGALVSFYCSRTVSVVFIQNKLQCLLFIITKAHVIQSTELFNSFCTTMWFCGSEEYTVSLRKWLDITWFILEILKLIPKVFHVRTAFDHFYLIKCFVEYFFFLTLHYVLFSFFSSHTKLLFPTDCGETRHRYFVCCCKCCCIN